MRSYHDRYVEFFIRYWLNGKNTANGWFSYDPAPNPIYSGASWINNDNVSGECLAGFKTAKFFDMALTVSDQNISQIYLGLFGVNGVYLGFREKPAVIRTSLFVNFREFIHNDLQLYS